MNAPQVIVLVLLVLNIVFITPNEDEAWRIHNCVGARLARFALWGGLLWWGGFWGV